MTETKLINGAFSQEDAQNLLTELTKTKIAFHERKITAHESEEDIKHSEKKIIRLSENLRKMLREINSKPGSIVDIRAEIRIKIADY